MPDPTTEEGAEIAREYFFELANRKYRLAESLRDQSAKLKNAGDFIAGDDLEFQAQEIHEEGQQAEHVDAERMIALLQALKSR